MSLRSDSPLRAEMRIDWGLDTCLTHLNLEMSLIYCCNRFLREYYIIFVNRCKNIMNKK